jgi:hypothetical protein
MDTCKSSIIKHRVCFWLREHCAGRHRLPTPSPLSPRVASSRQRQWRSRMITTCRLWHVLSAKEAMRACIALAMPSGALRSACSSCARSGAEEVLVGALLPVSGRVAQMGRGSGSHQRAVCCCRRITRRITPSCAARRCRWLAGSTHPYAPFVGNALKWESFAYDDGTT